MCRYLNYSQTNPTRSCQTSPRSWLRWVLSYFTINWVIIYINIPVVLSSLYCTDKESVCRGSPGRTLLCAASVSVPPGADQSVTGPSHCTGPRPADGERTSSGHNLAQWSHKSVFWDVWVASLCYRLTEFARGNEPQCHLVCKIHLWEERFIFYSKKWFTKMDNPVSIAYVSNHLRPNMLQTWGQGTPSLGRVC